jgi:hypothetical protein
MARRIEKTEKGKPSSELRSVPPPPNQRRLPFHKIHDEDFEEILVDIAEKEPGIVRAELKRVQGVRQYGVDVEGFAEEQIPALVISCKRYKRVQPANLTKWSTEFLKNIGGHWKDRGVKRFVLAVSVELNDDSINAQIAIESARFRAVGIRYEVWGLKKLTDKIRPLPYAIVKFFHAGWLEMIGAGPTLTATTSLPKSSKSTGNSTTTTTVTQSLYGVTDAVRRRLGDATANELETALQRLSEGVSQPLRLLVDRLKADRLSWDVLSTNVKAKLLRAEGSLAIRENKLTIAKACYGEADAYARPPDRTPSVFVALLEAGAATALELVANPVTSSEASVRAGLLLELGRPAEAIEVLDAWQNPSPTDDAYEPERLRSIALLWHDRQAALATISAVEHLAPRQFAVQWAAGVVRFNFSISEKFEPVLSTFPNPIPLGLVRDTEDARSALNEAERTFEMLSRTVDTTEQAADLRVWRLACLILNPARFTDAGQFAATLLTGDNPHPGAVVWATSAGLSLDYDEVVKALKARLKAGKGDASHAVAIAYLTSTRGAKDRAISGLRGHRKLFSDEADVKLVDYWIGLLTGKGGDSQTQQFNDALGKVRRDGETGDLLSMLDSSALGADMQLAAFETLALNGKWLEINDRRAALLAFGTSHASEVALRAASALNLHQDVIALANECASTFHGSRLPTNLGVLVAESRLSLGEASAALRAFDEMRADNNSSELAFELAMFRLRIGDLTGAAAVIRGRKTPAASPAALLRIAAELRFEDPELARRLLEEIPYSDLSHKLLPDALALVSEFGLQTAASIIMPRLLGPDAKLSGIAIINSVEEAIQFARENAVWHEKADAELTKKWLGCQIPLHLLFDRRVSELAWYFDKPFKYPPRLRTDGSQEGRPFLLRSGGRQLEYEAPSQLLILDITALLLGHELGLLENLEREWVKIVLPNETPELLRTIENELEQQFGSATVEALDVRERLQARCFALRPAPASGTVLRLVNESDLDQSSTQISLPGLIAYLVARGMDSELADKALSDLSLSTVSSAPPLAGPLEFIVFPGDLVRLVRVGLLDRLVQDVTFTVDAEAREQWLASLDHHLEGRALANKIKELRRLVARKADGGAWQFLPVPSDPREGLENSGVAVHLFYSLISAAERQPCEIWAEDRILSLVGRLENATIINVSTVLGRLSRHSTEPQRATVEKRLRNAGYGFLLPNAEAIVSALVAAPMRGAALVESDELAAIRRDFAVQFANSRYLIDKAGSATQGEPEMIFLSGLLGLAGKVFAALWSQPDISDRHLNAAAHWASRHLRVEQANFLPRDNQTVAGRESLLFLHYVALVGAMFSVTGDSFRQARERRAKLLQWVLTTVVEPALEIYPPFRDRLVSYFAEALAGLGRLSGSHPDVNDETLTGIILEYIRSFPDEWRAALQRHELLSSLVGLREMESIAVGTDFTFEAEQFYTAISHAYAAGKSTLPILGTKRNAVITRISDAEPAANNPVAFLIKAGNKTANVADDRLELEADFFEQRLHALMRHPSWFDLNEAELDAAAREIAENANAKIRRKLLAAAQSKAMTWRLQTLQEQISKGGSCEIELLLPPHPDSVRQFLRLSSPTDFATPGWLDRSFARLRKEVGPLGALARIGGIPLELGAAIDSSLVGAVDEIGHERAVHQAGPTPMVRTALYSALLKRGKLDRDIGGLTRPWNDYGVLFQALLKLAFTSAAKRNEWQDISELERSILLWAHTNAVLEILQIEGVAPNEAANIVELFINQRVGDTYHRSRSSVGRFLDPFKGTWRGTAGAAIAYAIRDRPVTQLVDSQRANLRATLARQVEDDWFLELELWVPSSGSEPEGCWLAVDPAGPLVAAGVAVLPPPFDNRSPETLALLLEQRIVDEAVDEEASGYWPLLWMLGVSALNAETRARMRALIDKTDTLPSLAAHDGEVWGGALRFRSELYGVDGGTDSFRQMLTAAAEQASKFYANERISDLSPKSRAVSTFHRLGEAILLFSCASSPTLNDCMARFAELVIVVAEAWPHSLIACLELLGVIAAQLDTEPAKPLWDAINLLRSH